VSDGVTLVEVENDPVLHELADSEVERVMDGLKVELLVYVPEPEKDDEYEELLERLGDGVNVGVRLVEAVIDEDLQELVVKDGERLIDGLEVVQLLSVEFNDTEEVNVGLLERLGDDVKEGVTLVEAVKDDDLHELAVSEVERDMDGLKVELLVYVPEPEKDDEYEELLERLGDGVNVGVRLVEAVTDEDLQELIVNEVEQEKDGLGGELLLIVPFPVMDDE